MSIITSNAASAASDSTSARMPNEEEHLENTTNGYASSARSTLGDLIAQARRIFVDDSSSASSASVASSSASSASEGTYSPASTGTSANTVFFDTPEDRQNFFNEVTRTPVNVDNFRMDLEEELKRQQEASKLDKEQLEEAMRFAEEDYRKRAEVMLDTVYKVIKDELIDVIVKLMNPGNVIKEADLEHYKKRAELERLVRMQRDELAGRQYTYPNTTSWTRMSPWRISDSPYTTSSSIDYSWQSAYGIGRH